MLLTENALKVLNFCSPLEKPVGSFIWILLIKRMISDRPACVAFVFRIVFPQRLHLSPFVKLLFTTTLEEMQPECIRYPVAIRYISAE